MARRVWCVVCGGMWKRLLTPCRHVCWLVALQISGAANDTGEDAALAIAALSTGGRRQWTQFRAALAQKRHLDML